MVVRPGQPDRHHRGRASGSPRPPPAAGSRSAPARPTARCSATADRAAAPAAGRPTPTSPRPVTASTDDAARCSSSPEPGRRHRPAVAVQRELGRLPRPRRHRQRAAGGHRVGDPDRPAPRRSTVAFTGTATDAEGDTPLTYAWDFGDGGTATTAERHATPTPRPGTFTATLTVTDARGAQSYATRRRSGSRRRTRPASARARTTSTAPRWTAPAGRPSSGRTSSTRSPAARCCCPPRSATSTAARNDATNLVLQPAPGGAWQATTKVTLPMTANYQQAGLHRLRRRRQLRQAGPALLRRAARVEFIRETAGTPRNEAADSAAAPAGDVIYLRLTSDGTNLTAACSADGQTFTPVGRSAALAGIANPKVGPVRAQRRHRRAGGRRGVRLVPGHAGRAGRRRSTRPTSSPAPRWTSAGGTRSSGRTRRRTGSPAARCRSTCPTATSTAPDNTGPTNFILQNAPGRRLDAGDEGRRQPAERAVPAGRPARVRRRRQLPEARLHRRQRGRASRSAGGSSSAARSAARCRTRNRRSTSLTSGGVAPAAGQGRQRLHRVLLGRRHRLDGVRAADQRGRRGHARRSACSASAPPRRRRSRSSFDYFRLSTPGSADTDRAGHHGRRCPAPPIDGWYTGPATVTLTADRRGRRQRRREHRVPARRRHRLDRLHRAGRGHRRRRARGAVPLDRRGGQRRGGEVRRGQDRRHRAGHHGDVRPGRTTTAGTTAPSR